MIMKKLIFKINMSLGNNLILYEINIKIMKEELLKNLKLMKRKYIINL